MMKVSQFSKIGCFAAILFTMGRAGAQEIFRQDFEHNVFQKSQDTAFKPMLWKRYMRVGEVDPKKCSLPQLHAVATAELSTEVSRAGLQSGKLVLDVSNGGVGHKAMFRNNLIKEGTILQDTKDEKWVSFSCFLPDTGASAWVRDSIPELIFQLHNDIVASPMLAIYSQNDRFEVVYRFSDTDPHTTVAPMNAHIGTRKPWSGEARKGQWLDWVFHVKFAPLSPEGFLEVWLNEGKGYKKLVSDTHIRIGYPCMKETDLDIGIYKWNWKCPVSSPVKKRTIYVDEISTGDQHANFKSITKHN